MSLKAYWAYEFDAGQDLEDLLETFNNSGPWSWQMRDSAWYGDYLNCRPLPGVRVRIHEHDPEGGSFRSETGRSFSALLEIRSGANQQKDEVDRLFRELMKAVGVMELVEIEPYD